MRCDAACGLIEERGGRHCSAGARARLFLTLIARPALRRVEAAVQASLRCRLLATAVEAGRCLDMASRRHHREQTADGSRGSSLLRCRRCGGALPLASVYAAAHQPSLSTVRARYGVETLLYSVRHYHGTSR